MDRRQVNRPELIVEEGEEEKEEEINDDPEKLNKNDEDDEDGIEEHQDTFPSTALGVPTTVSTRTRASIASPQSQDARSLSFKSIAKKIHNPPETTSPSLSSSAYLSNQQSKQVSQALRNNKQSLVSHVTPPPAPEPFEVGKSSRLPTRSPLFGKSRKNPLLPGGGNESQLISPSTSANVPQGVGDYHSPPTTSRRYKPGDVVLVSNQQSRWSVSVNRYGFPPGEGVTVEEMQGPYVYVLATVKQVHFEEFAAYYTVTRVDTGTDQRADADFMEPIRSERGENAAFRAAMTRRKDEDEEGFMDIGEIEGRDLSSPVEKIYACLQFTGSLIILPFLLVYDYCVLFVLKCLKPVGLFLKRQARLLLMGQAPYAFRLRLTMVNLIVVCSFWFMFIDQAQLAFFPPTADYGVAIANFVVWIMLLAELAFEVFIRPDGYQHLIVSEKAFAPQTVRFIYKADVLVEFLCLALFVPEFVCIFMPVSCSARLPFSFFNAALMAISGPTQLEAFYGRAYFALVRLRVFGLVRHWKNMWITNTFLAGKKPPSKGVFANIFPQRASARSMNMVVPIKKPESQDRETDPTKNSENDNDQENKDNTLTNASNIGTALMVTNSYRTITLFWVITGLFPIIAILTGDVNNSPNNMTNQLQGTNLIATDTSLSTCHYLRESVYAWTTAQIAPDNNNNLVTFQVLPQRCKLNVSLCEEFVAPDRAFGCQQTFSLANQSLDVMASTLRVRVGSLVECVYSNPGTLVIVDNSEPQNLTNTTYTVRAVYDQTSSINTAAFESFMLQVILLFCVLVGLSVLKQDAEVLVLRPLRRMLRIVARYAKNPLVAPKDPKNKASSQGSRRKSSQRGVAGDDDSTSSSSGASDSDDEDGGRDNFELGSFETEQLIAAVTKITDLLRKCWGVAGADIISTNLASREGALTVFNPTVPGKSVYALFGFVAINDFDHILRNLGGDVMGLINTVAAVLHDEVYRWGFAESGRCNKNLGGAFLMVFRIGLVKEVIQKLEEATDVIFSGSRGSQTKVSQALTRRRAQKSSAGQPGTLPDRGSSSVSGGNDSAIGSGGSPKLSVPRSVGFKAGTYSRRHMGPRSSSVKAMSLSLASLPGISTFTDQAVIGMLKAYASLHRDQKVRVWNKDFRLGAGVGAFTVSMICGMDAGWAVEGAVGSEYKIDATYLSPHVNMASRMMSACKQYGVTILLSQAVEELMSDVARSKLRHLDTVTVKGSSVKQKIFTYDARSKGASFFLFSKTDEQADEEANRYTPNIWNTDPDLNAMRQHVTEDFLHEFEEGRKMFLLGEWTVAKRRLERANALMVENAIDCGYLEADELEQIRNESNNESEAAEELQRHIGDLPSQYLLNFMNSYGGTPPPKWEGWHPLTRK